MYYRVSKNRRKKMIVATWQHRAVKVLNTSLMHIHTLLLLFVDLFIYLFASTREHRVDDHGNQIRAINYVSEGSVPVRFTATTHTSACLNVYPVPYRA